MKKHLLPITCLLAGLALSASCVEEIKGGEELAKNEIAFHISTTRTKAEMTPAAEQGATIPLGVSTEEGELTLVETIESLDFAPVTKGTPVYDENVETVYGAKFDAHDATTGGLPDTQFEYNESRGYWTHNYDSDPWAKGSIAYWMNMPVAADLTSAGVSDLSGTGTKVTFTYQSKRQASSQKDILFTARTITENGYKNNGEDHLTFFHALSGVKFKIGNKANNTKITKVELTGLYDYGKCTVTPSYASGAKSADCVTWTDKSTNKTSLYQAFSGDPVNYTTSNSKFGDTFYEAGTAEDNVNDANASLTFWIVPQALTSAVKLKVTFTVNGEEYTQTIDFGDKLKKDGKYPDWKAGELRTYTLTSNFVDVEVTDEVGGTDNDTKSNVVVTNTGNTVAFLRATIIGNWYDRLGKIVNVAWDTTDTYGTFTYPTPAAGDGSWVLESDGFWYYTLPVLPGEHTNTALFTSYQRVAECPGYPSAKLQLSIAVQAVDAARITDARAQGWDPGTQQTATTPETPQN